MDNLITACKKYIDNSKYGFMSCANYIVVLEKLDDTITNELRTNIVNSYYAKYRATKLKPVLIINKFNPSDTITKIKNTTHDKRILYKLNEILTKPGYDAHLILGIEYFKSIEQSFYYELLLFNPTYTGKYILWHENGNKKSELEYKDGKLEGKRG